MRNLCRPDAGSSDLRAGCRSNWIGEYGAIMRDIIKMTCGNCGRANYTTTKNKRTMSEKFEIKKFCPACRKHFAHKEGKISKG